MLTNKILSVLLTISFILPLFVTENNNEVNASEVHGMGCILDEASNVSDTDLSEFYPIVYSSLPPSFDITTNSATRDYFPPTGDQHDVESCVGWATTYYQFTYEVNRFRNKTRNSQEYIQYSPTVTYNYINCGKNNGSSLREAYNVLKNQGGFRYRNNDNNTTSNYSFLWPNNETEMVDALKYRSTPYPVAIGSNTNNIYMVKSLIAQGHVAVVSVYYHGLSMTERNGNIICYRAGDKLSSDTSNGCGHALTVVGYDDNFAVTINNHTFTGAFKLVNSWGTGSANKEYIWVTYDSLNLVSSQQNWENNYTRTRVPVFGDDNIFNFIQVNEYQEVIAGILSFNSNDVWRLSIKNSLSNESDYVWNNISWPNTYMHYVPLNYYKNYKLAYDYLDESNITNSSEYLNSTWYMEMLGFSSGSTINIKTKLVDNLGIEIASVSGGSTSTSGNCTQQIQLSLSKGKVSAYDNSPINSDDYSLVSQYLLNDGPPLSNLQILLADYNDDGEVDITDLVLIMMRVSANNNATFYLDDYIEQWGCSLADIMEDKFDVDLHNYSGQEFINSTCIRYLNNSLH